MAITSHKYSNGETTVVWQPHLCIHSGICARGLRAVFDPARKPWIDVSKADMETIIQQVKQCPSGAISIWQPEV